MMYVLDTNVLSELRKVHGMAVITRNVANFKPTGVSIINPWEPLP